MPPQRTPSPPGRPLRVFVSYVPEDQGFAKALNRRLSKLGIDVWDPAEQVLPGDNVGEKRGAALSKADAMVLLVSPDAVRSEWVNSEISYALGSKRLKGRLLPIVIRPTPNVPWILKRIRMLVTTDPSHAATELLPSLFGLPSPPEASSTSAQGRKSSGEYEVKGSLKSLIDVYERRLIEAALEASAGNQRRAAVTLGLLPTTLYDKMKRLGLLRGSSASRRSARSKEDPPALNMLDPSRSRS